MSRKEMLMQEPAYLMQEPAYLMQEPAYNEFYETVKDVSPSTSS